MKKSFYLILVILLNYTNSFSQSENLAQFDEKFFHFGFALESHGSNIGGIIDGCPSW